jgi:hypothetical protein
MATHLTYHVQSGIITGTAAGQRLSADTQPATSGDVGSWAKVQGLDVKWEVVDYRAGDPAPLANRLLRGAGRVPSPPGPATCKHYIAKKNLVFVDDGGPGLLIHGWPPCGGGRCMAVARGWKALFSTLARERRGSIRIL